LVHWFLIKTNKKVGVPPNNTILMKQLEILVQQQIPTWIQPWIILVWIFVRRFHPSGSFWIFLVWNWYGLIPMWNPQRKIPSQIASVRLYRRCWYNHSVFSCKLTKQCQKDKNSSSIFMKWFLQLTSSLGTQTSIKK